MPSATTQALARQRDALNRERNGNSRPAIYNCRVCKDHHPLKRCVKFLTMNVEGRMRAVLLHKYCSNCLAHEHYGRKCSSSSKCQYCDEEHHSLLHLEGHKSNRRSSPQRIVRLNRHHSKPRSAAPPRLDVFARLGTSAASRQSASAAPRQKHQASAAPRQTNQASAAPRQKHPASAAPRQKLQASAAPRQKQRASASRSRELSVISESPEPPRSSSSARPSTDLVRWSAVNQTHSVRLTPTARIHLKMGDRDFSVRALIDQCGATSAISRDVVRKYNIKTFTTADGEICEVLFRTRAGSSKYLDVTMKVVEAQYSTPTRDIRADIAAKFCNIVLADRDFFRAAPCDVVFGVDVYPRIILEGLMASPGLPVAQNSIFGWLLSGMCPK